MVYGMEHAWAALILVFVLLCSAGCSDLISGPPVLQTGTTVAVTVPSPPAPVTPEQSSDLALRPEDLPSDYILQDRSVMALPEVSQLARELGWRQGYYVSYYRKNVNTNDITRIRQSVSIFSSESIDGVFLLEKEELKDQKISPGSRYEIPFLGTTILAERYNPQGTRLYGEGEAVDVSFEMDSVRILPES